MMIGGAKLIDFSDAFERFHGIADSEQSLKSVKEFRFFEEVFIIEEGLEVLRWDKGAEEQVGIGTFSTFATPFEGGILVLLLVVSFVAGAEAVAILFPTFLHKKFSNF